MTDDKVQNIILSKRLPKDELDQFWDNLWGFLPATLFLIAGLGPILAPRTTMTKGSILIVLILGALMFFYTVYAKWAERNLKFIGTKLTPLRRICNPAAYHITAVFLKSFKQ
jgi:uncharacterized membrane protein